MKFAYGFVVRGRRPVAENRTIRLKHIRCAYHRLVEGRSIRWLSSRYRVAVRTISLWVKAALDYPDPEASALRTYLSEAAA